MNNQKPENIKVAIAQIETKPGDVNDNLEKHIEIITEAEKMHCNLVVFPELSLTGKDLENTKSSILYSSTKWEVLKSRSKKISIVVGFVEEDENNNFYISQAYIEDGEIKYIHRKLYPSSNSQSKEYQMFGRGNKIRTFETKFGRMGIMLSGDAEHITVPYILALDGAKIIINSSAVSEKMETDLKDKKYRDDNELMLGVYSRIFGVYTIFANKVGEENGIVFTGKSRLIDPYGRWDISAKCLEEDLLITFIDQSKTRRVRHTNHNLRDENLFVVRNELERIIRKIYE
jgi:predicted amidohydrolase